MIIALRQMVAYNEWANKKLCDKLRILSAEQLKTKIVSSFPSIIETVIHIHAAQSIWLERINRHPHPTFYSPPATIETTTEIKALENSSASLVVFATTLNSTTTDQLISYKNIKGQVFENSLWQILHHVVNHATYHRGQIITMLRQLNETTIPATDSIVYFRDNPSIG